MSIIHCDNCNRNIDTDFDAEHFDECGGFCECEFPLTEDMGHGEWKCIDCHKYIDVDQLLSDTTDNEIENYQLSH